jgi:cytochrome c oxidase subunit IV
MAHEPTSVAGDVAPHPEPFHPKFPEPATYLKVAAILTLITALEVWIYYIPWLVAMRGVFLTTLLLMSAAKFVIVVMFYMHLRYDHKLFRVLFTGPFIIAIATMVALMFLFSKIFGNGA